MSEQIYTILNTEGMSRTTKIQELAMSSSPYQLAQAFVRMYEDNDALRERVLMLETEQDAYKFLLSAHDKVGES